MKSQSKTILVTGGAGFIGSWVVQGLLQDEHMTVVVIDNLIRGRLEFLPLSDPRVCFLKQDILYVDRLRSIFADYQPNVVFHLAAHAYIPYCNSHPLETLRVNVEGTQSVLEAAKAAPLTRLVYVSSAAVYKINNDGPTSETDPVLPDDIYGLSKWFGEILVHRFQQETGVSCLVARVFNTFGPRETNPFLVPSIVKQLRSGSRTVQLGNLHPKRDFVHVHDVSKALRVLANSTFNSGFEVFNVGSGQAHSVKHVVDMCGEILGEEISISQMPDRIRKSDRKLLLADIEKIRGLTGWSPSIDLRQGLKDLLTVDVDADPMTAEKKLSN